VVATLSFDPRCLVASKAWLCCGGDDGKYIAVCLDEGKRRIIGSSSTTADADPDARLPLDLDPSSRSILRETISTSESFLATRIPRGPLSAKTSKIGEEVVNCIELWSPNPDASENAYSVPVAVLSNNDFTVSIVDISASDVLEELVLPDCVNRSVLSPSGVLLATICDDPYLYIHERVVSQTKGNKRGGQHQWVRRRRTHLPGQKRRDLNNMKGSFAVAFSPSGKYLAVATQYGTVCLFDAQTITDDTVDSLVKTFTNSRPGPEAGAIRDMAFSPGPFDLLTWTEHSGIFCVADMRNLCG
jgi:WD40 repeat protein